MANGEPNEQLSFRAESGNDAEEANTLRVYPNPTNNNFNLYYSSTRFKELNYSIKDLLGRELKNGLIHPNVKIEIDGRSFNNGIYFVNLINGNKVVGKQKIVIMK